MRAREDRLDHVEQRRLGPVQVLDGDHGRRAGGERTEEARPGEADLLRDRLRRRVAQRAAGQRQARAGRQRGRDPLRLDRVAASGASSSSTSPVSLSAAVSAAVVEQDAGGVPQDLAQRPVGDALAVGQAAPAVHGAAGLARHAGGQLLEQPALADPGLADDGDQVRAALGQRGVVQLAQQRQLAVAADEARGGAAAPQHPRWRARPTRSRRSARSTARRRSPRAWRRRPRSPPGGATRCSATAALVTRPGGGARLRAAERDDGLAAGDAGAARESQLADPQPGADGALGVVLVRDRRAEHGHERARARARARWRRSPRRPRTLGAAPRPRRAAAPRDRAASRAGSARRTARSRACAPRAPARPPAAPRSRLRSAGGDAAPARRPRGGAQLVAQEHAQLLVGAQRLGDVAAPASAPSAAGGRSRETAPPRSPRARRARRRPAAASERDAGGRHASSARSRSSATSRRRSCAHGASSPARKPPAAISPHRRGAPRALRSPAASAARRARRRPRGLEVDPRPAGARARARGARQDVGADGAPHAREQRAERLARIGGQALRPQQLDQLVARRPRGGG